MSIGGGFGRQTRSLGKDQSVKNHKLAKGTWRRVLAYARPFRCLVIAQVLLSLLSSVIAVLPPMLLRDLIDHGVLAHRSDIVIRLALLVAGVAVLDGLANLGDRWVSARTGEGLIYQLRTDVYDHVSAQPIAFFSRTHTGKLVSRIQSDVLGAQRAFTSVLASASYSVFKLVLVLAAMISLSPWLTLLALVMVPVFLLPARMVGLRLADLTRIAATYNGEVSATMTERLSISGALLVKLFGRPAEEHANFADKAAVLRENGVRTAMIQRFFIVSMTLLAALATALVYGLGGIWAVEGRMSVGTLSALAALLGQLYGPLINMTNIRVDLMSAMVSFERVFEVLDLKPTITEADDAVDLPSGGSVELEHVSFTYPAAEDVSLASLEPTAAPDERANREVLHDVSLRVEPGQTVALVGPSGSGKTTITHLLARLYDPTAGVVRINGVDVRDATSCSLQAALGYVTQDAHMFHDTIASNLRYARPDVTEEQMWAALEAAQIADLVRRLPDGLDTMTGERGYRLSGGERQRLAIARLLVKAPQIVVLDEATAHLDSESEAAVQRALDHTMSTHTSIVIAHRLSTVRSADQILVISDGRVVEQGSHDELMALNGIYAELYETQFAEQEDPSVS